MSSQWISWIQSTARSVGDRVVNWLNENNIEVQVEFYDGNQRYRRVISGPNRRPGVEGFVPVDQGTIFGPQENVPIGLTDEYIEQNSSVFEYVDIKSDKSQSCTICMEEFHPGERVRILPCFHQYHVSCVDEWLHHHPDCPICKFSLVHR